MPLSPWRTVAVPHQDVLKGTFQQAEFAADLARVHAGTATDEYQDATLFFARTFITEGMRLLLDSVVKRLAGHGGDPVIQLQTAFGGGKTHTMLAVYHLACSAASARSLPGVAAILDAARVADLAPARVAVLDGVTAAPNQTTTRDGCAIHTLWGELAWQLGGADGYALVAAADTSGTSPGKAVLQTLLARAAPCVILIDELVAYVRQFEDGKTLAGGSFDSNLSFVQALTEAVKAVPTAVLLASLPESEKEAGSTRGVRALDALAHHFGRVHALWKPVAAAEAFEIVRRRLFSPIQNPADVHAVCRRFADFYVEHRADFPQETQDSRYVERLVQAYPIHPEVFDRLYEDWSTLDNFQRTRGVLKLMAKVIHRLWRDGNNDALILPGSLPLYDADTRNELIYYLPAGWDPVIERDVDGERAATSEIENQAPLFGSVQACRRTARTVFLGSAPSTSNQGVRGLELERVLLGAVQPGQSVAHFKDALARLTERLHYLNHANHRFWLDTRPNLRREMQERKRRFDAHDDVLPFIQAQVRKSLASDVFGGIHVFAASGDIPDDWALRLVVLPPDAAFHPNASNSAIARATEILRQRGDQPRVKQNRLIFLAADDSRVAHLQDHVRAYLAWHSIVADYQDNHIVLDNLMARQAESAREQAEHTVRRMVRETYQWILTPMQQAQAGKGLSALLWEHFALNPGAAHWTQEIERVLSDNELLIHAWAPVHLARVVQDWFWKDGKTEVQALGVWQQSCQYLYLPRLKDDQVFQRAIAAGAGSEDFFGLAQGKEHGRYLGFSYGQSTSPILDDALLLIAPRTARAHAQSLAAELAAQTHAGAVPDAGGGAPAPASRANPHRVQSASASYPTQDAATATAFHGSVALDPVDAKKQFADLMEEVVQHFTTRVGVDVRMVIEIEASAPAGFDAGLQRVVKENCTVLKFRHAAFETEVP